MRDRPLSSCFTTGVISVGLCARPSDRASPTPERVRRSVAPRFALAPLALEPASVVPAAASASRLSRCCAPSTDARLAAADATAIPSAKPCLRPSRTPAPSAASASASTARAPACAGDDDRGDEDGEDAPASAAADIVPQITFDPWTASPMRVLGVSAVADGDERLDASPDIGAAAPERPGLVKPCTADDQGDRHTAPIVIAGLCTSSRLPSGHQRRIVAVACPPSAKADPRPSRMPPSPSAAPVRVSPRAPPLPKMTMTMTVATAHRRVRQLPPCRTSPPGDELRDPCAGSPSVPPPMATSATTPRPTLVPPRLNGPASPSPALVTIMVIGQLRLP